MTKKKSSVLTCASERSERAPQKQNFIMSHYEDNISVWTITRPRHVAIIVYFLYIR